MTEEQKPQTQKDRLSLRQEMLDKYEKSIGLPLNNPPGTEEELQTYLNLTKNQLEALDPVSARQIAVRLSQFAFYFQRVVNREKSIKIWAGNEITRIGCVQLRQYDQFTPNKIELLARENSAIAELQSMVRWASERIQRLEDISSGLRDLKYILSMVAKNKEENNE